MMVASQLFGVFMARITVRGGVSLSGEVTVSGSKNAALPIIFATLLTRGVSRISGAPDIGDVRVALEILEGFGASVVRNGRELIIDTSVLHYARPCDSLVSAIRASTYLLGSSLSRFGIAELQSFGGCGFQTRPIDFHIMACERFGACLTDGKLLAHGLSGAHIRFPRASVGATVNAILLAASAKGKSIIENYAREPHIFGLIDFLASAGAEITVTNEAITVEGRELSGGQTVIEGDAIEAGTYAVLSLLTGGNIRVRGVEPSALSSFFEPLLESGASLDLSDGIRLYGRLSHPSHIVALPYPDFPTDLQPIAATALAFYEGGIIEDRVWQGRFGYLSALAPFGVRFSAYPSSAQIYPSELHAADTVAPDLRGGAAALILALTANGESRISSLETIERGYEMIEEKLSRLGADIKIEN